MKQYNYGIVEARFRSFEQYENILCKCWSEHDANSICELLNEDEGGDIYTVIEI